VNKTRRDEQEEIEIHVNFTETLNNKIEDISDTLIPLYQGIRGHVQEDQLMFRMDVVWIVTYR
jgi:hypothetical protein